MLQTKTRWSRAALLGIPLFFAVPMLLAGCGGGGSSNPTPAPRGSLIARFSQPVFLPPFTGVTLPPDTTYSSLGGSTLNQSGYNALSMLFGRPTVGISFGKVGTIQAGDTFTFRPFSGQISDVAMTYNFPPEVFRPDYVGTLVGQSGTITILSRVNNPATATQRATTTVKFTLTNVVLEESSPSVTYGFTLNGTGEATIENNT